MESCLLSLENVSEVPGLEWSEPAEERAPEVAGHAMYHHGSPLGLELPQREVGSFWTVLS